ncbi:MAG TPA: Spy/CpxP family protein refolding chaperone [Thermoanaerobaculia bacterium]|jgi:Spy/CpxP family protein refolding chaperone|nr:Spy/CpxP family protein refolding chaperone [Thermoanaerobaculia bacterium]
MRKRIVLIALAIAALAAVPLVYAGARSHFGPGRGLHQGFGMPHSFGHDLMIGHLAHLKGELDLTDAQADQIKSIFQETRAQNKQYREQLHGTYKSVAQTLLANPSDVAAAQALMDQQTTAERALKTNLVNSAAKALAVLTPEQRGKLEAKLAQRLERWENRRR